jgi:HPt (histidine-containing phosphotransfer) domain-containing protein
VDVPQRLDAAMNDKNKNQLMKIAHDIKGGAASVFAMRLASIAKNAETFFRADSVNWNEAEGIVALMKSETEQLFRILQSDT